MKAITKPILAGAVVSLLFAAVSPAATPDRRQEEGWRLRVNGYWVDTSDAQVDPTNSAYRSQVDHSAAAGGGVSGEYRFTPRLGLELGLLAGAETDYTVTFDGGAVAATNTMAFNAACVGLNVHLTPGSKADFYAGPLVAHVAYSDVLVGVAGAPPGSPTVSLRFGDEIALGANLGVDVPISRRHWFFNANLKYLDTSPEVTLEAIGAVARRSTVAIDPLMLGAGFGYRF